MKFFDFNQVILRSGYLFEKEQLNRKITIPAVYDRFLETGRIQAFQCNWKEGEPLQPHYFWDSDVAKWMEGAAYTLQKNPNPELEQKIEKLIDDIEKNQDEKGYFNIYHTVCDPNRFMDRSHHELYCAGHLMEAAVAYAKATGRKRFLVCMERYADYIYQVFVVEHSAGYVTPGHEEIELALVKLYRYTGNKKYVELAAFFIDQRGMNREEGGMENQSHLPVRQQTEAVGHAVRAMYLYSAMADLALETKDHDLQKVCEALYKDVVNRKMYVTGGLGSSFLAECFTNPFDLPNADAYAETCAAIGLLFFCQRMLALRPDAEFADTIERALYNGMLSGLSTDGTSFFYENPLEITMQNHFSCYAGERRLPKTQRSPYLSCSCCPPNINRVLASLSEYLYGLEEDTLYVLQFAQSTLQGEGVRAEQKTRYPLDGEVIIRAEGVRWIKVRIPGWCSQYTFNMPYTVENGFAVLENTGEIIARFDMTPFAVQADSRVAADAHKLCVQAGPVVYCAEAIDNGENLHAISVSPNFTCRVFHSEAFGLNTMEISAFRLTGKGSYKKADFRPVPITLKLIPYNAFANRGESDMLVWFHARD